MYFYWYIMCTGNAELTVPKFHMLTHLFGKDKSNKYNNTHIIAV